MLSRVETSFYKPLGASLGHLLRQLVRDLYKALLQPACTFYNSVDDRITCTCASAPKWDGCEHVLSSSRWMWSKCRWRINSYPPALQTWEVGVFWSPLLPHKSCLVLSLAFSITFSCHWLAACERNPHEKTTISPRVQVQFSFGTIYNIKQELSNKWAKFES